MGKGLKPVLLARNLTLNVEVASNYKHMFRPHRGPVLHLWNIIVMIQSKGLNGNLIVEPKENHKHDYDGLNHR